MRHQESLRSLKDAEQHARNRLALFRARVYATDRPSLIADTRRMNELVRQWQIADKRLRAARDRQDRAS